MQLKGSLVAMVTPMADGAVDEAALREHAEWLIAEGSHGLVPVGTTGESPTLSHAEHERAVEITVEVAAGRVPVVAGAGSNNTAESLALVRHARDVGADAALVVTPYYNKPTQAGLIAHYEALAEVGIPIVIYNIPGRSIVDMTPETMGRLAAHDTIVGVKDATGDVARVSLQRMSCGTGFVQLSGEDASALGFNAHGGVGAISVTANVAPRLCARFQEATLAGDWEAALELHDRLMPLHRAIFLEPGLCGAKYALSVMGRCRDEVRLPLVPPSEGVRLAIKDALGAVGLI